MPINGKTYFSGIGRPCKTEGGGGGSPDEGLC